jgi:hypothetical protein
MAGIEVVDIAPVPVCSRGFFLYPYSTGAFHSDGKLKKEQEKCASS